MSTVLAPSGRLTHAIVMASTVGAGERRLLAICRRVGLTSRLCDIARWRQTSGERIAGAMRNTLCLDRIGSAAQARAVFDACAAAGARCINAPSQLALCADQQALAVALHGSQVQAPSTGLAMSPGAALSLARQMGYPLIVHVDTGQWTRLSLHVPDEASLRAALRGADTDPALPRHVFRLQCDDGQARRAACVELVVVAGRMVHVRYPPGTTPATIAGVSSTALQECATQVTRAIGTGAFTVEAIVDSDRQVSVRAVRRHIDLSDSDGAAAIDDAVCDYLDTTVSASAS